MVRRLPALVIALALPACSLCWPRGGTPGACPGDDDTGSDDDDDATPGDDDTTPGDDDTTQGDDDTTPGDDDTTPGDDDDSTSPDAEGMVTVPAGPFVMGCQDGDDGCYEDSQPRRTIQLSAFRIDAWEVTVGEFVEFLNDHGNDCAPVACINEYFTAPEIVEVSGVWTVGDGYERRPVREVTWYGAESFCAWAGKALPTEAQWEKAARGPDGPTWPWGEDEIDCGHAIFDECVEDGPEDVGARPAGLSPYGAWDMVGNVWEWVADWYQADWYLEMPETDPVGPVWGDMNPVRGGSWFSTWSQLYAYERWGRDPIYGSNSVGFRCASPPAP